MEYLVIGIETTIIGMGVVFIVLIILSLIISLLNKFGDISFGGQPTIVSNEKKMAEIDQAPDQRLALADTVISKEVVAAIMTAVSLMIGQPASQIKFTAIKRIEQNQSTWNLMGNAELIDIRQRMFDR